MAFSPWEPKIYKKRTGTARHRHVKPPKNHRCRLAGAGHQTTTGTPPQAQHHHRRTPPKTPIGTGAESPQHHRHASTTGARHRHAKPYRRSTTGTPPAHRHITGAQHHRRTTGAPNHSTPAHKAQAHRCHHSTGKKNPDRRRVWKFKGLSHKLKNKKTAKNKPIATAKSASAREFRFGLVW